MSTLKPLDEMTTDEKLTELLGTVRELVAVLNQVSDSPMAKMIPGFAKFTKKK